MSIPNTIGDYLRMYSAELGERVIQNYPALHQVDEPLSPRLGTLPRKPPPAQALAIMSVAKRWQPARSAAVIAECGTGKTLISLAPVHVHSDGKRKRQSPWFRRTSSRSGAVKRSMRTPRWRAKSDTARRKRGTIPSRLPAAGGKLGWFWQHSYAVGSCGRYVGNVINPDTSSAIYTADDQLRVGDFRKVRLGENIGISETVDMKALRAVFSPRWQADGKRISRVAPVEFIGRYMDGWFDYALCDEAHQLAGDTAQGNGLGTLAACADKIAVLTGTLLGGYADDLDNLLFRLA